jgi:ABC-type uncharacterized transport system auxiliary subunit
MSYKHKLMLMSVFFVLSLVFGLSGCTFTETTSNATTNSKANSTADGKAATRKIRELTT